jgi:hypothetical protein
MCDGLTGDAIVAERPGAGEEAEVRGETVHGRHIGEVLCQTALPVS